MAEQKLPKLTTRVRFPSPAPLPSGAAHCIDVIDPATQAVIDTFFEDDVAAVDRAVRRGRAAFDDGPWPRISVAERQCVLRRIADLINEHAEALVALEVRHTGLPIAFVRAMHVPRAAQNFRFFADYIGQRADRMYTQEAGYRTYVTREPVGVAALIAPWNVPLGLGLMKTAAAIAFGNACVVKPSEATPLSFPAVMPLFAEAGVPDGVVNLVNGRGHVTGAALVAHPGIDAISFTGGTETGRVIGMEAARRIRPVTMELGGKSANIICDDADLDAAVAGSIVAAFANNGQQCLAGSRLLVQRGIADAFIDRFVAATKALRIGAPTDPATQLGPLISAAQRDRVLHYAALAVGEGATLLSGGRVPPGLERGYYVEPTIVEVTDSRATVAQDEVFGPLVSVQRFDTVDDAIALANDSDFGLVGYAWTASIARAQAIVDGVRTGVMWVNTPMMRDLRAPFGGWRDSGLGAEGGDACAALYTREKTAIWKV